MIGEPLPIAHHRGVLLGALAVAVTYRLVGWTTANPLWSLAISAAAVTASLIWHGVRRGYWDSLAGRVLDHLAMHPHQDHRLTDVARAVGLPLDSLLVVLREFVADGYATPKGDDHVRLTERGVMYAKERAT